MCPYHLFFCGRRKRKYEEQQDEDKPYIKKPPNAFMLFLKEQRSAVSAEIGVRESAVVNAELGKRVSVSAAPCLGSHLILMFRRWLVFVCPCVC